jgi:hypothetical protein
MVLVNSLRVYNTCQTPYYAATLSKNFIIILHNLEIKLEFIGNSKMFHFLLLRFLSYGSDNES